MKRAVLGVLGAVAVASTACGVRGQGGRATSCVMANGEEPGAAWEAVCEALAAEADARDGALLVGTADGVVMTWSSGEVSAQTRHPIASASKWLTAAAIMRLVERGELALDARASDHLVWWSTDADDPRSRVTLRTLLAFTSGFEGGAVAVRCVNDADTTLQECARALHDEWHRHEPGEVYFYGPAHLHVAAAMAEAATERAWSEIFADEVVAPLGMDPSTRYTISSEANPRVAGGIEASGADYARFLTELMAGRYLADARAEMLSDQSKGARIAQSPITASGQEWRYALGAWKECQRASYGGACPQEQVYSSPGLYGFYPWLDARRGYWAVWSTKKSIWSNPSKRSVQLGQKVRPEIEAALGL
jgi:CubicO group peptidase (beta-lactamase class C family)